MRLLWFALHLFCVIYLLFLSPSFGAVATYSETTYCPLARSGRDDCTPKRAPPSPTG
ncbi:hypothetical protein TorRG33x02_353880, partial [Trema orientale]